MISRWTNDNGHWINETVKLTIQLVSSGRFRLRLAQSSHFKGARFEHLRELTFIKWELWASSFWQRFPISRIKWLAEIWQKWALFHKKTTHRISFPETIYVTCQKVQLHKMVRKLTQPLRLNYFWLCFEILTLTEATWGPELCLSPCEKIVIYSS